MTSFYPLLEQDLDPVRSLLTDAGLPAEDLTPSAMPEFVGIRVGGNLAAIAGLERYGDVGLLRSVVVLHELQSNGLGKQLVTAIESRARTHDIQQLVLLTTTAEQFFKRLGYLPTHRVDLADDIQRSPEFARLCPASAVCLTKKIGLTS